MRPERGHRAIQHTADVILEAWAPDLPGCLEEAVAALVGTYAEAAVDAPLSQHPVAVAAADPETMLLDLLDDVIFTLDTADGVPVGARVGARADGGIDVVLLVAPPDQVEPTGSAPKAISHSELAVVHRADAVSCRFLVDV